MIKKLNLLIVVIFLVFSNQVIKAQRSIGPPSLDVGTQACGRPGPNQNEFTVTAQLSPGDALPTNNQFILELSDPSGSFSNGGVTQLASITGPNNGTSATQDIIFEDFPIPEDANSDNYRLRVTSSEVSTIVSQISDEIAFHFFDDGLQIILNDRDDVIFCNESSISTSITVRILDENDIPVDANDYEWVWTKDDVVISGQSSPTLGISQEGRYRASVPLGRCQGFFAATGTGASNVVDAILLQTGDVTITANNPTLEYCPQDVKILFSGVDQEFPHQWLRDGIILDGEISTSITLPNNDFAGLYTLMIEYSDDCTFSVPGVTVTNISSTFTVPLEENLILLPTQTLSLTVETNAPLGSIFRFIVESSVLQQGPLTNQTFTFDAPFVGTYRIEIEPDDSCNSLIFTETTVSAAERFELTIGAEDGTDCDQDTITIELLDLLGVTSTNDRVPLTEEQFAFFDLEWFKDGVSTGETSLSLDIDDSESGGSFELVAVFRPGGLPNTTSNNLPFDFLPNSVTLDINPPTLEDGIPVTLTAPLSSAYTYEWYQIILGQDVLISGETTNTLTVTEEGQYFVTISSLICPAINSEIAQIGDFVAPGISEVVPNVITPFDNNNINDQWVLPSIYQETDVDVTIYSENGKIEFQKTGGYNADWPLDITSETKDDFYYYIIVKNNKVVKKGTITVMR